MIGLTSKYSALIQDADRRRLGDAGNLRACFQLLSLTRRIDEDCASRLSPYGLSEGKFVLLSLLSGDLAGLSPHQLSECAGVTRATVTGLVDGLERSGLVERARHEGDRRSLVIRLTQAGRNLADTLVADHMRWIASAFDGVSEEDLQTLSRLLGQVGDNLDTTRQARTAAATGA